MVGQRDKYFIEQPTAREDGHGEATSKNKEGKSRTSPGK